MLRFAIYNQELRRVKDTAPATDSVDYLKAQFDFKTDDWAQCSEKYAIFTAGDISKRATITNNACKVPHEVLKRANDIETVIKGNYVCVTVVGIKNTMRITTNELVCMLNKSGYVEADSSGQPTPDLYEQFVQRVEAAATATDENAADVEAAESRIKNDYCNALKGTASGEVIRIDDVSPLEHSPKIWVHGKNLLNIPDTVVEGDYAWCNTQIGSFELAAGTYTLSVDFLQSGTDKSKISISARKYSAVTAEYASNASTETNGRLYITFTIPEGENGFTLFAYSNVLSEALNTKCIFSNFQIEKGNVVTEYTPFIDVSNVTLTRCEKSVFAKYSQVVTGNAKPWTSLLVAAIKAPVGDYVAHCKFVQMGQDITNISMSVRSYNDYAVPFGDASSSAQSGVLEKKFTVTEGSGGFQIFLYSNTLNQALTTECHFENICVEYGTENTGFAVYNGESYTPAVDGSCNVVSVSPTMTLLTDTEGVTIECEYNRDINKVIADILNKVGA